MPSGSTVIDTVSRPLSLGAREDRAPSKVNSGHEAAGHRHGISVRRGPIGGRRDVLPGTVRIRDFRDELTRLSTAVSAMFPVTVSAVAVGGALTVGPVGCFGFRTPRPIPP